MPVYHFTLRNRDTVAHRHAGREYPDLRAALADAHRAARSMIHNRRRHRAPDLPGSFDVEDARHQPVARILLADLVRQLS